MEVYIGSIMTFGFSFAPSSWQMCSGQLIPLSQYQALFALLGTSFGGNGTTSFQLPDLRGRLPLGQGAGPGLSPRTIGEFSGNENVSMTIANMPTHTHTAVFTPSGSSGYMASTNTAGNKLVPSATNNVLAGSPPGTDAAAIWATNTPAPTIPLGGGGGSAGGTVTNAPNGSSLPAAIMNPYLVLNFCIAMQGIFPTRN